MSPRFRRNRFWERALCLFLVPAFLTMTFSCAHPTGQPAGQPGMSENDSSAAETQTTETRTAKTHSQEKPWWKNPEYEWLLVTLIVIGVGVAAGAAIMISSGAGGLYVNVQK